ncbi:MAG: HAD family hydrolase [Gammaproteobacteria bacterium]
MWSGPRNISTAMMRAWENRPDTAVVDEPFYAYFLSRSGLDHPGRDEVIASQPTDWREVVEGLLGPVPGGRPVFYQKQMTHHVLPGMGLEWLQDVTNCFLIRHPREVVASYVETRSAPTAQDLGFARQADLFRRVADQRGEAPPVVDAADVLRDPGGTLAALCKAVGVPFYEAMLSWPPGRRASDGVWAPYWYASVEKSTGFRAYRPSAKAVPPELESLVDHGLAYYEVLSGYRIQSTEGAGGE